MVVNRLTPTLLPLLILALLWVSMMMLGTGPVDEAVLSNLYAAHMPALRTGASIATLVGEWQSMMVVVAVATAWLLFRRRFGDALRFAAVTLIGRLMILMQKEAVGRLRPEAEEHLVVVKSLSFPSAHTANTMIVFLSLALIAAPERYRRPAIAAALAGTLIVGLSRPMLGVHWPSDVIGGWSFGALWVLLFHNATKPRGEQSPHSHRVQAR